MDRSKSYRVDPDREAYASGVTVEIDGEPTDIASLDKPSLLHWCESHPKEAGHLVAGILGHDTPNTGKTPNPSAKIATEELKKRFDASDPMTLTVVEQVMQRGIDLAVLLEVEVDIQSVTTILLAVGSNFRPGVWAEYIASGAEKNLDIMRSAVAVDEAQREMDAEAGEGGGR